MANKEIPDLTLGASTTSTDLYMARQGADDKKFTIETLFTDIPVDVSLSAGITVAEDIRIARQDGDQANLILTNSEGGFSATTDGGSSALNTTGTSGLVSNECITFGDTDGEVGLNFQSSPKLETTSTGVTVNGHALVSTADASVVTVACTNTEGGSLLASDGGSATMAVTDSGGVVIYEGVEIEASGATILKHQSADRLSTDATGVAVHRESSNSTDVTITNTEGGFKLSTDGGIGYIYNTDESGAVVGPAARFTTSGSSELYYDGTIALSTVAGGVDVTGGLTATTVEANNDITLGGDSIVSYVDISGSIALADETSGGNVSSTTADYALQQKIGTMVVLTMGFSSISVSGLTGTNNIFIRGLPYTPIAPSIGKVDVYDTDLSNAEGGISVGGATGNDYILITKLNITGSEDILVWNDLTDGVSQFDLQITYFTDD